MGVRVTHGALDHAELAARGLRPEALLDWSSNLNPFGPPPGVRTALAALDPAPYPDRSCLKLRAVLAARHGCDSAQILVGNGSNELIHLIPRALLHPGDLACVVAPTFGEYGYASQLAGLRVVEWRTHAENHFAVDCAATMREIRQQRPHMTWLCAPNNPTGVDVATEAILVLAEACGTHKGLLVLDRTYHAFVRGRETWTDQLHTLPSNVLLLHSLTKSYALAGLRVGYLIGATNLLARIADHQPTWSVNSAAQAAGLAALAARCRLCWCALATAGRHGQRSSNTAASSATARRSVCRSGCALLRVVVRKMHCCWKPGRNSYERPSIDGARHRLVGRQKYAGHGALSHCCPARHSCCPIQGPEHE